MRYPSAYFFLGWSVLPGAGVPGLHPRQQRSRAAVGAATEAERVTGRRQLAGLARATLLIDTRPEGPGARFGGGRFARRRWRPWTPRLPQRPKATTGRGAEP